MGCTSSPSPSPLEDLIPAGIPIPASTAHPRCCHPGSAPGRAAADESAPGLLEAPSVEPMQPDLVEAVEVEQRRRHLLYRARVAPAAGSAPRAGFASSPQIRRLHCWCALRARASASRGLCRAVDGLGKSGGSYAAGGRSRGGEAAPSTGSGGSCAAGRRGVASGGRRRTPPTGSGRKGEPPCVVVDERAAS